jgi:hypothetical protein
MYVNVSVAVPGPPNMYLDINFSNEGVWSPGGSQELILYLSPIQPLTFQLIALVISYRIWGSKDFACTHLWVLWQGPCTAGWLGISMLTGVGSCGGPVLPAAGLARIPGPSGSSHAGQPAQELC